MSVIGSSDDNSSLTDALHHLVRGRHGGTVSTVETVSGRVVLQEDHVAGDETFGECRFEVSARSERLDLKTETRVYEEIRLHKTQSIHLQTISTTLRREQAEIDVGQQGEGSLTAW